MITKNPMQLKAIIKKKAAEKHIPERARVEPIRSNPGRLPRRTGIRSIRLELVDSQSAKRVGWQAVRA